MVSEAVDIIHQDLLPIQLFLTDWRVRVTWIAFLTLWVLWGLSWFARHAFGGTEIGQNSAVGATNNAVGNTTGYATGNTAGNTTGYAAGNTTGYAAGNTTGYTAGDTVGNNAGYTAGDTTATTDAAGNPTTTGVATDADEAGLKRYATAPAWSQRIFYRLNRAHDMLRDLLLMLLSVLTLNTFARASTTAAMILAWIFVAFAIVWCVVETAVEHRWLRFGYSILFFALALTIAGLAYAQGFQA